MMASPDKTPDSATEAGAVPPDDAGPWARLLWSLDRVLQWAVIVVMGALALDVLWGVASRYVLGDQARWTEELARLLLVWVSMLGAALVYRRQGHLGVDYFVGKLHEDARCLAARFVAALVLVFALVVFVHGGWLLVMRTLETGQVLPALGLRKGWAYSAVPISGICIALFALDALIRGPQTNPPEVPPEGPPESPPEVSLDSPPESPRPTVERGV